MWVVSSYITDTNKSLPYLESEHVQKYINEEVYFILLTGVIMQSTCKKLHIFIGM